MHFVLLVLTMVVIGMCGKIKPCARDECPGPDGKCAPLVYCIEDPCVDATCPSDPCAKCTPNYCGGCHPVFYNEAGNVVDDCSCNEVQCLVSTCQCQIHVEALKHVLIIIVQVILVVLNVVHRKDDYWS
eukprot:UN07011